MVSIALVGMEMMEFRLWVVLFVLCEAVRIMRLGRDGKEGVRGVVGVTGVDGSLVAMVALKEGLSMYVCACYPIRVCVCCEAEV